MTTLADAQLDMLVETLRQALHVPFYRRRWRGREVEINSLRDLARLPVITRDELLSATDFMREGAIPAAITHSSGTTGGPPLVKLRGREELEVVADLARRANGANERPRRVIFTTLDARVHGGGISVPSSDVVVHVNVTAAWGIEVAASLMTRPTLAPGLDEPEVTLHGRPRHLAILARELLSRGFEAARQRVTTLLATGYPVSRRLRTFFGSALPAARVVETYSLSEVVGGGVRCERCDAHHFAGSLISEVVELESDEVCAGEVGRLVVTELYPFSIVQPFIRYDTGDLVRRVPRLCGDGLAFQFVGRGSMTPVADVGKGVQPLLSIWRLTEVLEDLPLVARGPLGTRLAAPYDAVNMGAPLAAVTQSDAATAGIVLDVGVTFAPALFPDHARSLSAEIIALLRAEDDCFRSALDAGVQCDVRLCGPERHPPPLSLGK